jgi:diadenylate cyclase
MTETTMKLQDFFEQYIVYPWETFRVIDILDWLLMTLLFYTVYMLFRGRVAARVGGGLVAILLLSVLAEQLGMSGLHSIMAAITPFAVILLAVIYQPELRDTLARIGSFIPLIGGKHNKGKAEMENTIHMVADAACQIAQTEKDGALIVLELFQNVDEYIDKGYALDMEVDRHILCNMFKDKTLFHDGAVVIRRNRVVMAGCKLPLRKNGDVVNGLGTRHRAAVGITDVTDCVVVVVSEETHKISIANHGNIERDFNQSGDELRNPEARQRIERNLRRALHNMLIGLEVADDRNAEENRIQVRFKWGFNLDAEDRERINKERERQNIDREKFEKNYEKNYSKQGKKTVVRTITVEVDEGEDADKAIEKIWLTPNAPSEENVGMPSVSLTPPNLTTVSKEADGDTSDEA